MTDETELAWRVEAGGMTHADHYVVAPNGHWHLAGNTQEAHALADYLNALEAKVALLAEARDALEQIATTASGISMSHSSALKSRIATEVLARLDSSIQRSDPVSQSDEGAKTMAESSEMWHKERMYGERDTVLWAITSGVAGRDLDFKVIGSALKESDADRIIADHEQARLVVRYAEALGVLKEKIEDERYHPQYTLGMAYARQLFEALSQAAAEGK